MARVRFGDVVKEVKINIDRKTDDHEFFIAGEHMESENIHITKRGRFADSDVGPAFIRLFKPGQILYGSRRTYLKKVAVADFEGITSNTTFVLETKDPNIMLQELLPFIMLTDSFTAYAVKNSKGSTNPYILFSDLAAYEFELPDIEEQKRLTAKLLACDRAKEAYKKQIQATDDLVKSQFIEMVGKATSSDKLLNHVDVLYGFPFNSKLFNNNGEGLPLLRIRDINTGLSDTFTTEQADEKYIVSDGDCLVGMDGNFEIVKWNHGSAYLNQRMCKFTPIDIQREYMMYFLRLKLKEIESVANSTTVKHLSAKDINGIEIPIVDDAAQLWFEEFSIQSDKSKFELQQAIEKVDNLIKSLIQQDNN